ncbi:Protein N-acetyltransferase, RimJ/RimL family [Sanguibacter gelidistatuariae]|uniref:Protein N-acetyltransferase, RimJ/RimL family n=1 Tax=Sanguibacter gelidistatuariae TaxID=1814289 RepID=A0A1G6HES5_9MICO|nr:GNAT family protein [Sanguibacter gelidistatuariae]SDB92435.1 Protein N-acetyltransferase, RimJ/RimL family [Sanguibacter gelidistatuariae]
MDHTITLEGFGVRLVPLAAAHAPNLAAMVDAELWSGMSVAVPDTTEAMTAYTASAIATPGRAAFVVLGADDGVVRGSTSLYDWVPAQERVELGSTFYARQFWGGATNPACKLLLMRYAFEEAGINRLALRADARNARSLAAITRLGAVHEGVLREHRIAPDGSRGDTVYFSILAREWPDVRDRLLARLAEEA